MTNPPIPAADREALRSAAELHGKLARAARVARLNGLGYAAFGVLSSALALPGPDGLELLLGVVLTAVGVAQVRAAPRLARGESSAARHLSRNELVLMVVLVLYCLFQLIQGGTSGDELRDQIGDPAGMGPELVELADVLHRSLYAGFLCLTLLYQGGLALWFSRVRPLAERYLSETPAWVRETVESLRS